MIILLKTVQTQIQKKNSQNKYNKSNNIFQKQILKQEKLSANWDLNPDPSVSGRVPLPLDHLHS